MGVVKGGVWTNIEDEILKASVSKYGLNQWARVSSLLARKTPKQCKARWNEWLDPSIKKIEWSKEEDEKLLHLAKLMPTQWRTIAPIGKKAKRKARERQQEESRRLAALQKRRELKTAGINIKVVTRKKGQMDYNADIPFEKKAAPGFYDTTEEEARNEQQRLAFDPRKQQLASKRKGDGDEDGENKRRKKEKEPPSASFQAAMKAGQMQKIREAEQSSKRRALNLPAPQVSEGELEEIVKMGMVGERANMMARESENDATRGLVSEYSTLNNSAPIRTPRAPAQEDHIANEIRNIRALTNTQSSLLGGENTPLHEGAESTGFDGIAPRKQTVATPNPMATPMHANGVGQTPARVGQTPMRTPRDSFALNANDGTMVGATPRDVKMRDMALRSQLRQGLASLPKPKDTEWELELPDEQKELAATDEMMLEDAAERDRREAEYKAAQHALEMQRRTQVMQKNLPRPSQVDVTALLSVASQVKNEAEALIAREAAALIANDAVKYPSPKITVSGVPPRLQTISDNDLAEARLQILSETNPRPSRAEIQQSFDNRGKNSLLLGLGCYGDDEEEEEAAMRDAFDSIQDAIVATAEKGIKLEKKLALHLGGYQKRQKMLKDKIGEAAEALEKANNALSGFKTLAISEEVAIQRRLGALRDEVGFVSRREREAQELYRKTKEELDALRSNGVNGHY
uniref:Pre-mRNA splicing factor cef1 n=1 Tax=Colletotrichum fructicola (strain Nara gc5) TaxID=1213859 RepID=L2GED1_COLFN